MKVRIVFTPNEVPEEYRRASTIKDVVEVRKVGNKLYIFTEADRDVPKFAFRFADLAEFEVQA